MSIFLDKSGWTPDDHDEYGDYQMDQAKDRKLERDIEDGTFQRNIDDRDTMKQVKCPLCGAETPKHYIEDGKCGLCKNYEEMAGLEVKKLGVDSFDDWDASLNHQKFTTLKGVKLAIDGNLGSPIPKVSEYIESEKLIKDGGVEVNGKLVKNHLYPLQEGDTLKVKGQIFKLFKKDGAK